MNRRHAFATALSLALLNHWTPAAAQPAPGFPGKAVRWVVPYPAGGGSDFLARTVSQPMSADMGQSVLVDNKPGANGAIAVADIKRTPADGYSLVNVDNGILVFNSALYKNLGYAPEQDLQLVTLLARSPLLLVVGPTAPARDARELVEWVRSQPGKLSFGSAGAGTPQHMAMELFSRRAGLRMTHIPYRGSAPALGDLAGGQFPVAMSDFAAANGFLKAGKLRALAVASSKRHPALPDVPTLKEAGIDGVEVDALVGVAVRSGTPPELVEALQRAVRKAVLSPEVSAKYKTFGMEPSGNSPAEFQAMILAERQRWHPLIKELGISLD